MWATGGDLGTPFGAIYLSSHVFSGAEPQHLSTAGHRMHDVWTNDENFYDTTGDQPGPDGEGLSLPIDETALVIAVLNGETVNLAAVAGENEYRDLDDLVGQQFDKNAGILTRTGIKWTFGAPFDGTANGEIGVAGELRIPLGALPDVDTDGLEVLVRSAGGEILGRLEKTELLENWNRVSVLYADPVSSSGAFDPTAIDDIEVNLAVLAGSNITDIIADHISFIVTEGASSAPVIISTTGHFHIDIGNYFEGDVGRAISAPMLVRDAGSFFRAQWDSIENANQGSMINRLKAAQELPTRTIEARYAEAKYSRYGPLVGGLARDWFPLSRIQDAPLEGRTLWVQIRMTMRNRVIVPLSP